MAPPSELRVGYSNTVNFHLRKLSSIPPSEIYLFFTWIQNKILFFQEMGEQSGPVSNVPGLGRI